MGDPQVGFTVLTDRCHPWVIHGLVVVAHGSAMGRTWISRWYIKPWVTRVFPMGLQRWSMGHPWVTHGSPPGPPRIPHE